MWRPSRNRQRRARLKQARPYHRGASRGAQAIPVESKPGNGAADRQPRGRMAQIDPKQPFSIVQKSENYETRGIARNLKGIVARRIDSGIRQEFAQGSNLVFRKAMVDVVESMGEAIQRHQYMVVPGVGNFSSQFVQH
jgi:hypothetical protein